MIGSLTLDQLRVLVAIAESGSFSAAGRRLGRVQSAISQSIASLEEAQGVSLFDRSGHRPTVTDVGRVLIDQARAVLASASRFEAVAAGTRDGLEPELAVAIDPLVPTAPLIDSLRALRASFPNLPVSFSTEGLGGAERRLRSGKAAVALCLLIPAVPDDITAIPLLGIRPVPVVAAGHPLASLGRPASRADLQQHVQLILSDPTDPDGPSYGVVGTGSWKFVDLARRMDFLLAGFGWCRMPEHLIKEHVASGRLVPLELTEDLSGASGSIMIYAAHIRDRALGQAGRWLLEDLATRLA
ncbi:LysR family transcriptional regulator [Tianweitania sediminis]|uniref:LysR family transcriptional regulator n=1 Tax=Tianweitania sediminis TaxID=1502156 RepID=A0A8J7R513_9HYPH|nr:LysR family transcriptional regulator [Tianweitania sediminis]MBP0437697.1 LysR family transcriptional regulator [Tianweitania sediminis]